MTALTAGEVERLLLAILLTKAILLSLERQVHENIEYLILFKTPSKTQTFCFYWLDFLRQVAKAFTPVLDFSHFLQALALSAVFYLNNSLYLKLLAFWKKKTPFIDQKYTSDKVPNSGNARKSSCFFSGEHLLGITIPTDFTKRLGRMGLVPWTVLRVVETTLLKRQSELVTTKTKLHAAHC